MQYTYTSEYGDVLVTANSPTDLYMRSGDTRYGEPSFAVNGIALYFSAAVEKIEGRDDWRVRYADGYRLGGMLVRPTQNALSKVYALARRIAAEFAANEANVQRATVDEAEHAVKAAQCMVEDARKALATAEAALVTAEANANVARLTYAEVTR